MKRRERTATGQTNRPRTSGSQSARLPTPIKPSTPRSRPLTPRAKPASPRRSRPVSSAKSRPMSKTRRQSINQAANILRDRMEDKFSSMTAAFRELDKDGDGKINSEELQRVLDHNALGDIDAAAIIAEVEGGDSDGHDGDIDVREFLAWISRKTPEKKKKGAAAGGVINARNLWEQNPKVIKIATMLREKGLGKKSLKKWFNAFDEDRDGQIDTEELHTMLSNFGMKMTHDDVQEVLDCFDVDGDGGIHFSEFVEIVQDTSEDEIFDTRKEFEQSDEDDDIGDWVQMAKSHEKDPVVRAAQEARKQMHLESTMREILRKRGRMVKLFRSFDDDGSGEVTTEEFTQGLQKFLWEKGLKTDLAQVQALVNKVDSDGDGKIEYHEFFDKLGWQDGYGDEKKAATQRWENLPPLKGGKTLDSAIGKLRYALERRGYDPSMLRQLMMAFRVHMSFEDIHDSVTKQEFRVALEGQGGFRPSEHEMRTLIDALDIDGDGTICLREFAAVMHDHRGISLDLQATAAGSALRRTEQRQRRQNMKSAARADAQEILATLHRGGLHSAGGVRQSSRPRPSEGARPPWLPLAGATALPTLSHLRSDRPWQTSSMAPPTEAAPRVLVSPSLKAKAAKRLMRERDIVAAQRAQYEREKEVEDARLEKCYGSLCRYMRKINKVEKKNFALGGGYGTTKRMFKGNRAEDSHCSIFG